MAFKGPVFQFVFLMINSREYMYQPWEPPFRLKSCAIPWIHCFIVMINLFSCCFVFVVLRDTMHNLGLFLSITSFYDDLNNGH